MVTRDTVVVRIYQKDMKRVNQWREKRAYSTLMEAMAVVIQRGTLDLVRPFETRLEGKVVYVCPACYEEFSDKGLLKVHITQVELG